MDQQRVQERKQVASAASEAVIDVATMDPQVLQEQMNKVASQKFKEALQRQSDLRREIDELSSLDSETEKLAMKHAELESVNVEITRRGEDLATMAAAISAQMENFGVKSVEALEDSEADIAKREGAKKAVVDAQVKLQLVKDKLAGAKSKIVVAQTEKKTAESQWWNIFGKAQKVTQAQSEIDEHQDIINRAPGTIANVEAEVKSAQENIIATEEEIQLDKRERINSNKLEQSYALVGQWVQQAKNTLKLDIAESKVRIVETKKSYNVAIKRRLDASERLQMAEEDIAQHEASLMTKEVEIGDITDRTDPTYQRLSKDMSDLSLELQAANNERMLAESNFSDAEIAIKERETSLAALDEQMHFAMHQFNRFAITQETFTEIGANIEVLLKGSTRQLVNESLDKGIHKVTVAVYDLSRKQQIAAKRELGAMAERKHEVLQMLSEIDAESSEVLAADTAHYEKVISKLREGYEEQGLDLQNMSHLAEAATLSSQAISNNTESTETEMF